MKKAYTKPELLFENYELNTAGGCTPGLGKANQSSPDVCSYAPVELPFMSVFYSDTANGCDYDAESAGICYQSMASVDGGSGYMFHS